jgi:hypothetical protein
VQALIDDPERTLDSNEIDHDITATLANEALVASRPGAAHGSAPKPFRRSCDGVSF